ncbi:acyl-CoA dehydrogenase family protein [Desulfotignum balticum]|uniref:acyl-CoA dehydrogenase family protein n=1 Tax=Desulfotignum balticum TaxID=115781 RepID=UPI0004081DD2|nr:acyl-CoA dehydrogenase family protein [Desulfotignum balticum]
MDFNLSKEQLILKKSIKEFVRREVEPVAEQTDRNGYLPDELIQKMVALHLPGMIVSQDYGGSGSTLFDCALAIEELSYSGCGAWWYAAFTNSLLDCISTYGTKRQKSKYLPSVIKGKQIPSIQFTEDQTGADPRMLQTRAVPDNNGHIVNGMKRFSTFGSRPGNAILYALDQNEICTAFVMEKLAPGYSCSNQYELMGSGGIEAVDVYLDNVRLPEDSVLESSGEGFAILLYWIAIEKILQNAACVGIAQAAMDEAISYSASRALRTGPQHRLQGVQFMIAEMYARLQACRWVTYHAAFRKDVNDPAWVREAAASKIFVVQAAMEIVDTSRKIHGAYGYTKAYKVERLYRAIAGASAIAGSLEVNRSVVANALIRPDKK